MSLAQNRHVDEEPRNKTHVGTALQILTKLPKTYHEENVVTLTNGAGRLHIQM